MIAAAVLAYGYAVVLLGEGVLLAGRLVTATGFVAAKGLHGRAGGGVATVALLLALAAVLLGVGATRVLRGRGRALLVAPLVAVLVIGTIGETADLLGTATRASDLIGVAVLVAAALPVLLLASSKR